MHPLHCYLHRSLLLRALTQTAEQALRPASLLAPSYNTSFPGALSLRRGATWWSNNIDDIAATENT